MVRRLDMFIHNKSEWNSHQLDLFYSDLHGAWENVTVHHAPLYMHSPDKERGLSIVSSSLLIFFSISQVMSTRHQVEIIFIWIEGCRCQTMVANEYSAWEDSPWNVQLRTIVCCESGRPCSLQFGSFSNRGSRRTTKFYWKKWLSMYIMLLLKDYLFSWNFLNQLNFFSK